MELDQLTQPVFYITHLYPEAMNIYGDMGNILAMQYRLRALGIRPVYQPVPLGKDLPSKTDWYFMGGGQDAEQSEVIKDLAYKKKRLFGDVSQGIGLLAICGGYQLLGQRFLTGQGELIPGLGLFEVETRAPGPGVKARCIGNLVTKCNIEGLEDEYLVGFENHSGQTSLLPGAKDQGGYALGRVVSGQGNTLGGEDEGYVLGGAVGTYLHGSCLPKNPHLAQWFVDKALERKGLKGLASRVDDTIARAVNVQLSRK